jgi:hypothetical protein
MEHVKFLFCLVHILSLSSAIDQEVSREVQIVPDLSKIFSFKMNLNRVVLCFSLCRIRISALIFILNKIKKTFCNNILQNVVSVSGKH